MNASMGALIAASSDYIVSTINSGNTPFFYRKSKCMNLSFKQDVQIELLLLGLIVAISGCSLIIIYSTKILTRRSGLFFKKSIRTIKKFELKRLNNSKSMVKFIPFH